MGYVENLRKIVGNQPLNLVGVAVAVINENGEFLLQKRNNSVWGVPGGFMELGEAAEETGRREVLEETGLEIGHLQLVDVFSGQQYYVKLPNGDEFYPVTIAYVTKEIKGGVLKADGEESKDVQFFKINELPEGLSPLLRQLIGQFSRSLSL
ncbi:ADP-ribose pyrophosphatase YjhB (NUDIX family) [Cytobacillus eiseniae]|uniref:ADP-ribose pyrophosphatase YjhB (NUDIX family) n=1 Tax=Cytobacillus eiseniae TaxID=762947 RepID=A0ABS4R9X0_9BACI|nr:NUDIX hydrolase [Cytobacillus eiseniae]MBP2239693.1 ADP-ribose pyrophosphatase YjhB (NUDIX family) [Cytobacillus eiseniae]